MIWRRRLFNPWLAPLGIVLGVLWGFVFPATTTTLGYVSHIYLLVLQMSVIPILVSLVTISVSRLSGATGRRGVVPRVVVGFPLAMLGLAFIVTLIATALGPGRLDNAGLHALGVVLSDSSNELRLSLGAAMKTEGGTSPLLTLALNVVPANYFEALSSGNAIQLTFGSILFGAALGTLKHAGREAVTDFLDGVYHSFLAILNVTLALLPLGAFAEAASQTAHFNLRTAAAMGTFTLETIAVLLSVALVAAALVGLRSGRSLLEVLHRQRALWVLAITSRNSLACLPLAIESLTGLGMAEEDAALLAPLSISLCRFGTITYFAFAAVFVTQLYRTPASLTQLAVVALAAAFAGIGSVGLSGVAQLGLIGIVLNAIDVPFDAAIPLLVAIDALIDPFRTLVTVTGGMFVTAAVGRPIATAPEPVADVVPAAAMP